MGLYAKQLGLLRVNMEITQEFLVQVLVWILGALSAVAVVFFTLIVFTWRNLHAMFRKMGDDINARLKTLGHEDRDIRGQVSSVMTFLVEHLTNEKQSSLKEENTRLKWIIEEFKSQSSTEKPSGAIGD